MKCSLCNKDSVYEVRYSGSSLCGEHLSRFVERRVKQEIRSQLKIGNRKTRISVAISGGKDSSVTLYLLHKVLSERTNVEISAFTVDEGIEGYRSAGLESARALCRDLNIPHETISYKENFGYTMDEIVAADGGKTIPCAHCGPMRRQLMNRVAAYQEGDFVALGINLDDYAQSILMNVAKGDAQRMARMAPHSGTQEGLVPRVLPLRKIPEKEVMLYAVVNGIKFEGGWCPYYAQANRNKFRSIVSDLEEENPGTKYAIVNFLDSIRGSLTSNLKPAELGKCRNCGSSTTSDLCVVCRDLENLRTIMKKN